MLAHIARLSQETLDKTELAINSARAPSAMESRTKSITIPANGSRTRKGSVTVTARSTPQLIVLLESSASGRADKGEEDPDSSCVVLRADNLDSGYDMANFEGSLFDTSSRATEKTSSPATTATNNTPESTSKKAKWDPLGRYWSDAHSFPDYGSPQSGGGIMFTNLRKNLSAIGGFSPINRLAGSKEADSTKIQNGTPKRSQDPQPTLPKPKRPKTTQHTSPTRSIGGDSDVVEVIRKDIPRSAKEFRGSMSTQSNGERKDERDVQEYRQTQAIAGFGRLNKRKHRRRKSTQEDLPGLPAAESRASRLAPHDFSLNEVETDPIEDAVELVQKPMSRSGRGATTATAERTYTNLSFAPFEDDDEISEVVPKAVQEPVNGHRGITQRHARTRGKHTADSSDDELQAVDERPPSKRRKGDVNVSFSLSTRGSINRTDYSPRASKNDFGAGLLVKRAVAQPGWMYPASTGTKDPMYSTICYLGKDEKSLDSLIAVDTDGKGIAGFEWLTISLQKVNTIFFHPDSSTIMVKRPTSITSHGTFGPLLLIDLNCAESASVFIQWAKSVAPKHVDTTEISVKALDASFENQVKAVSKFIDEQQLSHKSPTTADDIKLIEHKQDFKHTTLAETTPSRTLRSRMQAPDSNGSAITSDLLPRTSSRLRPSTRSSHQLKEEPLPKPELWTEKNPDWAVDWKIPLNYQRATVDKEDIMRLDEGQFMNDSLISFYLKYLHHQLEQKDQRTADKIYIFNSFFYDKLKAKGRGINYDGVKNWTTKVDLFSFDYIIVPVNEASHWWVTIICNPGELLPSRQAVKAEDLAIIAVDGSGPDSPKTQNPKASRRSPSSISPLTHDISHVTIDSSDDKDNATNVEGMILTEPSKEHTNLSDLCEPKADNSLTRPGSSKSSKGAKKRGPPPPRKYDPRDPRIITLDSLGSPHSSVVRSLKEYLMAEAEEKKGEKMENPGQLGTTVKDIPMQDNFTDCGVYLLGYIKEFMQDPDKFISDILQKEDRVWQLNASELRNDLRNLILKLQKEHQAQEQEKRRVKAQQKRSKERSREQSEPRSSEKGKEKIPVPPTPSYHSPDPASNSISRTNSRHASPKGPTSVTEDPVKETRRGSSPVPVGEARGPDTGVKPVKDSRKIDEDDKGHLSEEASNLALDHSVDTVRESIEPAEPSPVDSPPHTKGAFQLIPESPTERRFLKPLPSSSTSPPSSTRKPRSKEHSSPRKLGTNRGTGTSSPYFFTSSRFGSNRKVTRSKLISDDDSGRKKETIDLTT